MGSKHGKAMAVSASALESAAASRGSWFRRTARSGHGRAKWGRSRAFRRGSYDPQCYLCPGNQRAGGAVNPAYDAIFSFVNDYAALLPDAPAPAEAPASPLLVAEPARGICKVLCFHPDHSLTLARMTRQEIRRVVDAWAREYQELGGLDWIEYVQIFENRGAMMGASNPHPHGQIWATGFVPDEPAAETAAQREHLARTRPLPALRLRCGRARGGRARGFRERAFRRAGSMVGGVAVRGAAGLAAATWARCRS